MSILNASFDSLPATAYVRQRQILELLPYSSAKLWRKCKAGDFPKPVKLSQLVSAWNVGDIRQYLKLQSLEAVK
jgi:predicted DNA-binding transcriptional regulator AlpA